MGSIDGQVGGSDGDGGGDGVVSLISLVFYFGLFQTLYQSQSISGSFELVKYLLGRSEFTLPAIALALFEFFPGFFFSL